LILLLYWWWVVLRDTREKEGYRFPLSLDFMPVFLSVIIREGYKKIFFSIVSKKFYMIREQFKRN